jgi:hypothetical protein
MEAAGLVLGAIPIALMRSTIANGFFRRLDKRGFCAGYIYVLDPGLMSEEDKAEYWGRADHGRCREFIDLSRASTNRDPHEGSELLDVETTPIGELSSVYSMVHMIGGLDRLRTEPADENANGNGSVSDADDEKLGSEERRSSNESLYNDPVAHFDVRLYDATAPWGLFNVMMIERSLRGVATRVAVGRIRVAAFINGWPAERYVELC